MDVDKADPKTGERMPLYEEEHLVVRGGRYPWKLPHGAKYARSLGEMAKRDLPDHERVGPHQASFEHRHKRGVART